MKIPTDRITPNPQQPRRRFPESSLRELADSLRINGLLLPIAVEEGSSGDYTLIDGERRLRAARLLGWTEIEASVRPGLNGSGERERAILALVANLQRADLNPVEEARAYQRLSEIGMSHAAIAHRVGVSAARVVSRLSILDLDEDIQDLMAANLLPIDPRVVAAILSVPEARRSEFALRLARPNLRIKTVQTAAEKLNAALSAERIHAEPALTFSARKAGAPVLPNWNALRQLGKLPPWEQVVQSARATCQSCALRPEASAVVCSQCPAVVLLVNLIEVSHVERAH